MLAVTPLAVPLATALATGLAAAHPRLARGLSFVGALAFLVCAAALVARTAAGEVPSVHFGAWPAPFAIAFAVDRVGALLILVTAVTGCATLLFQEGEAEAAPRTPGLLPLVHGLLAGSGAAFATADLFNLYVWFELLLVCTVGLLALEGGRRALEATFKYLVLNLLATAMLLAGVALVYGATGQLSFATLADAERTPELSLALGLLFAALLIKSAAFPFCSWLPASYPTLPAPVLALAAGLLTKVGVYALLRLVGQVFAPVAGLELELLGWIACATMVVGVLGAMHHQDVRRLLAFHAISQNGYLLLGLALGSSAGLAATLFYTLHYIVVKANLFLIAGLVRCRAGSHDLRRAGGLHGDHPWLAAAFLLSALALVGIPPLSGFWAKFLVVQATLAAGRPVWAAVALGVSLLTLYSMSKIWLEAFWKPHPAARPDTSALRLAPAHAAVGALLVATLALGLVPGPWIELARAAAAALGGGGS